MNKHAFITGVGVLLLTGWAASAEPSVVVERNDNDDATGEFAFKTVPPPCANDAATAAQFTIVDGEVDPNSGGLGKLHDGKLPDGEDDPGENFFFQAGTDGGRLQIDLGHLTNVKQVNTYSWHPGTRGPQSYKLYASDGSATNFNASPKRQISPEQCGWKWIATIDTQAKTKAVGGQYGVDVFDSAGNLGEYRYLLFDIAATEQDDGFGNTFFSEIDVVDASTPPVPCTAPSKMFTIKTDDGKSTISINSDQAPALKDWAEQKLAPVLAEWYPKIAAMLPSDNFTAPASFRITLKPMDGVAYTAGKNVTANSDWLEKEIGREAIGSLVHEAVHVVQAMGGEEVHNPGWLVEGTADYIRWFKYEPQSHGADIVWMRRMKRSFNYDGSYRITANFLNYVTEKYDKNIVAEMNAAMRQGQYDDKLWEKYTGKKVQELGAEWKADVEKQIAAGDGSSSAR